MLLYNINWTYKECQINKMHLAFAFVTVIIVCKLLRYIRMGVMHPKYTGTLNKQRANVALNVSFIVESEQSLVPGYQWAFLSLATSSRK